MPRVDINKYLIKNITVSEGIHGIISILQSWKLRLSKIKNLSQGHSAGGDRAMILWQHQNPWYTATWRV